MAKVMLSFEAPTPPSLDEVKRRFGLRDDDIDATFGVIEIDSKTHTYTIRVEEAAAARITGRPDWKGGGPYSDPKIAPFGPPKR
jgi:hypothetical protein